MKIKAALLTAVRGLALAVLSMVASLTLFILTVLSISFISLGIGAVTTPPLIRLLRDYADTRRRLADEWFGVKIRRPYRPHAPFQPGIVGLVERNRWILTDTATWRDLLWLLADATGGFVLGILAFSLFGYGPYGWVLAIGVWRPIVHNGGNEWFGPVHITSQMTANLAALFGTALMVSSYWLSPLLMRLNAELTRYFLAPDREGTLRQQVEHLTETRTDAVDVSAAELRRIERDLHDGAQARLVAMGMSLGAIEHLMEHDPAKARILIAEARESSSKALTELRDLVRGIHPPVLAERGLGDAVRALALTGTMKTEVTVELAERLPAPLESATYFAVSEVLTNAAKHSGAEHVWIDIRQAGGMLRIMITDDGRGGADVSRGTGLRGIERRLGTFDGIIAVNSPLGGPTIVTMEIPCA